MIIDENGRFLDNSSGSYLATDSILKVGIKNAIKQLGKGFIKDKFISRGGIYEWNKDKVKH